MKNKNVELKIIFVMIIIFFAAFLFYPAIRLAFKSFETSGGIGIDNYIKVLTGRDFTSAFVNSLNISIVSAVLSTLISFIMAYTINFTNTNRYIKK